MEEIWTRSLGFWLLWCKCVWPLLPTWEWPSACILDQGCLYLYIHLWKLIWNRKIIQLKRSFSSEPTIPGPWVKKMSRILGRPKGGFQSIIFHVKNLHLKIICKAVVFFFEKRRCNTMEHPLYTFVYDMLCKNQLIGRHAVWACFSKRNRHCECSTSKMWLFHILIFIAQRFFEFNLFIFIVELSENWAIVGETCAAAY